MLGGAIFCLLCALFAGLLWLTRPSAPGGTGFAGLAVVRSAMPPLLLGWCMLLAWGTSPLIDTLRLRATQLEVASGGDAVLRVGGGGDPARTDAQRKAEATRTPDLVVPPGRGDKRDEAYADYVTATTEGAAGKPRLKATLRTVTSPDTIVLTSYETSPDGAGSQRHFVGAVAIRSGARLCFARCAADGITYTFGQQRLGGVAFRAPGQPTVRLQRRGGFPGWMSPWKPEAATYPARNYFPDAPAIARSILFEDDGHWYVLPLDSDATVTPAGEASKRNGHPLLGVEATGGTWLKVQIGRVALCASGTKCGQIARGKNAKAGADDKPVGLTDRLRTVLTGENARARSLNAPYREQRSFTLRTGGTARAPVDGLVLALDKPDYQSIGALASPRARLTAEPDPEDSRSFTLGRISGGNRPMSVLGAAIEQFPQAFLEFIEAGGHGRGLPGGVCQPRAGEMCAGTADHAIRFRIDRVQLPWLLLWISICVAAATHLASARVWTIDRVDSVVLSLTQFLLALRAVISVEGTLMDTGQDWHSIFSEAGVAMIALPCLLIALRRRRDASAQVLSALLAFALAAFAAVRLWAGPFETLQLVLADLAIGALVVRLAVQVFPSVSTLAARVLHWSAEAVARHGLALAVALIALRTILPLVGVKERLFGIAVSTLYLPPLLIALAAMIARADAVPACRSWAGRRFVVVVLVALGATSWLARDDGFALVYVWPVFGVAMWRALAWRAETPAGARGALFPWLAPVVVLAGGGALALALLAVMWRPPALPEDGTPATTQQLTDRLAYANAMSQNDIRLLAVVAPDYVPEIGSRDASQQMEQTIHLFERTRTLFGLGYAQPSNLPLARSQDANFGVLRDVHLTDNVSAVHLMAPFGRGAAVTLLAVLAAAAAGLCGGVERAGWHAWRANAGALAIWTIFGAAAYMILANLLLVPFTGRNIYLLAPTSGSDLIESAALLGMALVGLRGRQAA